MTGRAIALIESALKPMIEYRKRDISKMVLNVYPGSSLMEQGYVETKYGVLVIVINPWLTKGTAYIMEEFSIDSTFGWVSRKEATKHAT